MKKSTLLVSACLLGQPVRYDGQSKPVSGPGWDALGRRFELIPVCPECIGGLPTPRPAAEISGGDGDDVLAGAARVQSVNGDDVTSAFVDGARRTLEIAGEHRCTQALLKANSPSCGNRRIYDGGFSSTLRDGRGVTASLLERHSVQVWNEEEIGALLDANDHPMPE
ncbi:DUF523 domain-containing protein [Chromobacterium sp. ATCC 53434]|uniref:DUF523 domain-containing protein n=1 Tax=Chromobacterium TaxID=535 RepID=UPI000C78590E|nr:DUF523 domain-containing protein [Chromobacterium sp. ATCC 53434]AUH52621.1 DUF523 domain-containing protein [Chromobacterium sp. ATCC 53434]